MFGENGEALGGKSLTMCAFVATQYQRVTDRQKDGQTDRFVITISRCACIGMLTRDKDSFTNGLSSKFTIRRSSKSLYHTSNVSILYLLKS